MDTSTGSQGKTTRELWGWLWLVASQVVGMADGRLQSDCILEDGTRVSTVCSCPHHCDT